jgi:HD-like signal output (HDOD) protein/CheY-like chemotaxis protein
MTTQNKPSLIFVDDEENVLRGLGRMLRGRRNVWDMRFAISGRQALEMMAEKPADVVVSDMKMPEMDGSELLRRIQAAYPGSIRIVLSGFAEREAVLKTIGPSHRYLAKPTSDDVLISSIDNALALRAHIHDPKVTETVAGLTHLPTLPRIYADILAELSAEHGSAESLATKIEQDVGITAQLMKLTNSAYFSLPQKCRTARQAVMFLGFDNVRAAVLLAGVFDQFKHLSQSMIEKIERLGQHSLAIGVLAQAIIRQQGGHVETADQAFCSGLLAHVGTLLLIAHNPQQFNTAMRRVEAGETDLLSAEREAFGATHTELGAYLLGLWGFTDAIVEAVAFHHRPSDYTKQQLDVLTAVHVAQYMTRLAHGDTTKQAPHDSGLDEVYLSEQIRSAQLTKWQQLFEEISKEWPK